MCASQVLLGRPRGTFCRGPGATPWMARWPWSAPFAGTSSASRATSEWVSEYVFFTPSVQTFRSRTTRPRHDINANVPRYDDDDAVTHHHDNRRWSWRSGRQAVYSWLAGPVITCQKVSVDALVALARRGRTTDLWRVYFNVRLIIELVSWRLLGRWHITGSLAGARKLQFASYC